MQNAVFLNSQGNKNDEDNGPGKGFGNKGLAVLWMIIIVGLSILANHVWVLAARYLHKWRYGD